MTKSYSPRNYWNEAAKTYNESDEEGLGPVLHPNVPSWYNRTIDAIQLRAVLRAIRIAKLDPGSRILDVGCGTGRWLRRYESLGFCPMGVDATLAMLALALKNRTNSPLVAGESFSLPFADSTFDATSDITVLQHLLPEYQPRAVCEMLRVIKPGGRLILMELIRGHGTHIFPRSPQGWIDSANASGASLVSWFGQEFMLVDRAFVKIAKNISGRKHSPGVDLVRRSESFTADASTARNVYWKLRKITAPLSSRIEPIAENLFPGTFATHGVFVFAK